MLIILGTGALKKGINEDEILPRETFFKQILKKFVDVKNPGSNGYPKAIMIPVFFIKLLTLIP